MARSTKVETEHRIKAVYKLLSEGKSRGQVLQFVTEKWGVSERTVDMYMARAREKLLQDCEMERPKLGSQKLYNAGFVPTNKLPTKKSKIKPLLTLFKRSSQTNRY